MMVPHCLLAQMLGLRQKRIYYVEATALVNAPTPLWCEVVQESISQGQQDVQPCTRNDVPENRTAAYARLLHSSCYR